jgi:hypothetical protein
MNGIENGMIVNILIKKEDGIFVAHCLELDIVATGDTLIQAQKDIVALICAQIDYAFSNDNLENLYHPAPKEVWAEFYRCRENTQKRHIVDATFADKNDEKSFVPPWIIAKTCQAPDQCNV